MLKAIVTKLFIFSCVWVLTSSQLFAAEPAPKLETQGDKESYSIGYQVGQSLNTDGVEVNLERVIEGLQDAVNRKDPRVKDEEMKKLIVDLKKRAREAQLKKMQEQIVRNAQESEKFLEENKTKEGVKVTESGLQYRILKEGKGPGPGPEDFVKVNYRGTFIDGSEFDSSYSKGEPARVQTDGVIKGWTEALQMRKTGSKWQLFVPPELAYGRGGLGQRIPPNKVLVFGHGIARGREGRERECTTGCAGRPDTEAERDRRDRQVGARLHHPHPQGQRADRGPHRAEPGSEAARPASRGVVTIQGRCPDEPLLFAQGLSAALSR